MSAAELGGYLAPPRPPATIRAVQVLLYVTAGFTALVVLGSLVFVPLTAESLGAMLWTAWPGAVAFVLARRVTRGGRVTFWFVVGLGTLYVLQALAAVGNGDPRGITNLLLPIAVLVLVTRRSARQFLLQPR